MGLFFVGTFGTNHKSPVLVLSLNLATTDTIASLLNGLSFLFNSYLPVVFGHDLGKPCLFVVLELFRMSAFISSVLHLLALASIHYNGTVRPLHYRVRACCSHHVTRSIHFISLICWLIPLILFCIYFSSIPCQGFQSPICDYSFFATKRYRYFYLVLFLLPLIFMLILYVKIFFIIRQNQLIRHKTVKSLNRAILIGVQEDKKMSISTSGSTKNNLPIKSVLILRNIRHLCRGSSEPNLKDKSGQNDERESDISSHASDGTEMTASPNTTPVNNRSSGYSSRSIGERELAGVDSRPSVQIRFGEERIRSNNVHFGSSSSPKLMNTRALVTSLLILGTYLLFWVPALAFQVLTCIDGCPYPYVDIPETISIPLNFVTNFLVILKATVDPFIYTLRIREVRLTVKKTFKLHSAASLNPASSAHIYRSTGSNNSSCLRRGESSIAGAY
ncbi:uncharacterized protein LOC141851250 isoform X2 [Brevipalpus obovatus]|uniref:uncharacterized protein LOC141851250 isoform X2 n=1 Tax=Brevipalpus obovatus TaxID=246614 RepID=UPI003D9E7472